jgi:hypothetical protein
MKSKKLTLDEKINILDEVSYDQETNLTYFNDYADALIGYTVHGENTVAVYDYSKCIKCLMKNGMSRDEAVEYFEYNTVRTIPYMGSAAPIIMEMF